MTPDVPITDITRYVAGPLRPVMCVDFHADMKAANLIEHVRCMCHVCCDVIWKIT